MPNRDAMRGPAALVLLSALAFFVFSTGCRVIVDEASKATDGGLRSAMSASAAPLPQYAVAISAVDFDPPLKGEAVVSARQPIKLVAAVENKGTMQLSKLRVEARVASQPGDFSLQDQVSLDKLSPGETRVVEFQKVGSLANLPKASSFRIMVSIDAPQLDSAQARPSRELTVRVSDQ